MTPVDYPPRGAPMSSLIPKTTVGGTGIAAIGAVSHNELLAILGFVLSIGGFCINWYFQWKRDQRDAALHAAQLTKINRE